MIRYRLLLNAPLSRTEAERTVTVAIDATDGDEVSDLVWSGADWAVDHVQRILERQRGNANQMIEDRTSPRHLATAVASRQMAEFNPVLECGEELLRPPPPETAERQTERLGAMTASILLLHLPAVGAAGVDAHHDAVLAVKGLDAAWREWRGGHPSREEALRLAGEAIAGQLPAFAAQLGPLAERADVPASVSPEDAVRLAAIVDEVAHREPPPGAEQLAVELRDAVRGLGLKRPELPGVLLALAGPGGAVRGAALRGVDLRGQKLSRMRADDLDLSEADLRDADLAEVTWHGVTLRDARLEGADLREAVLRMCDLDGARAERARFTRARLEDSTARGARLDGADLTCAILTDTDFSRASLRGATLEGAEASGADFRGADLRGANLRAAVLTDADLRGADLTGADLEHASLDGADLRGAAGEGVPEPEPEQDLSEAPPVPPELLPLVHAMTPVVQELFRTAGRRGALDPEVARRLVEEASGQAAAAGGPGGGGPSVDEGTLLAVSQALEVLGSDALPKLFAALRQPDGAGPPPEIQAMIRALGAALSVKDPETAEDVLEMLQGKRGGKAE